MPGIGETLREARLSRGLTHQYISQIIKIRAEFLQALEEENYAALPGNFYAKNFLRRYADALDLDSSGLVERFVAQENEAFTRSADAFVEQRGRRAAVAVSHRRPNFGALIALLLLTTAGLVLAYGILGRRSGDDRAKSNTVATPTGVSVALAPTATFPVAVATPAATRQPNPTEPVMGAFDTETPAVRPTAAPHRTPTARPATATPEATPRVKETPTPEPRKTPRPQPTDTPGPTDDPRQEPTNTPGPTDDPKVEPTDVPEPTATPAPEPTATPKPTRTPTPEPDGAVVATIRTIEPSSVTVKADGRTVFQATIDPDAPRSFSANANLYVYSSSAQKVQVSVNECRERTLDEYGCTGCVRAYYNFQRSYFDCRQD